MKESVEALPAVGWRRFEPDAQDAARLELWRRKSGCLLRQSPNCRRHNPQ
jgi:hypothetical protein